jgi:hypothetical protein
MTAPEDIWCPVCNWQAPRASQVCELHGEEGRHLRPVYGMCLACRSMEVELNEVVGTRDLSSIGESDVYPVGYGCEVCA